MPSDRTTGLKGRPTGQATKKNGPTEQAPPTTDVPTRIPTDCPKYKKKIIPTDPRADRLAGHLLRERGGLLEVRLQLGLVGLVLVSGGFQGLRRVFFS